MLRAFRRPPLDAYRLGGVKIEPTLNENRGNMELKSIQNRARRPHGSLRWLQDDLRKANLATKTPKWSPTWAQDDHKKTPREAQRTSWGHLGASWRLLGRLLGPFFKFLLQFWAICKNSKKHWKTNGFSLIFKVLGGLQGSKNQENRWKLAQRGQENAKMRLREARRG